MTNTPGPRALTDGELSALLAEQQFGILATQKRNGRPHLATVVYRWDAATRTVRVSTTADRAKPKQLARDGNAAIHVQGPDVWTFAVAEGEAEVSAVTTEPGDEVGRELLALLPVDARPDDPTEFWEQQIAERRVVIRLKVDRLYGTALDFTS
ncbi:TIGR03618 family F420-dependent PPOX class oxidoreductase [Streptomyces triticagri]|uniref:TIGR03618 family F420-dependent PPOX class oxidoreductase n=1 Tax=Streptomyces triticagri TaxID=2293568 RepID=A0A372LUB6_9ACTN|nr:TIGR03618 family F420-dependent PPOX class oxidoreductase [Streptomyces triticagri]RFU82256.1 TIGR03618 family F420-dependent PPOX class oxidoreductase [Streptomyces triticagri]